MSLPLTPEQEAWLKVRQVIVCAITEKGPVGRQCRHCAHGIDHPFSERYYYCGLRTSSRTAEGYFPTKRTNTCDLWHAIPKQL